MIYLTALAVHTAEYVVFGEVFAGWSAFELGRVGAWNNNKFIFDQLFMAVITVFDPFVINLGYKENRRIRCFTH